MNRPSAQSGIKLHRRQRRRLWSFRILWFVSLLCLAGAVYYGVRVYTESQRRDEVVTEARREPDNAAVQQAAEGQDETETNQALLDAYQVAADQPRILTISKLGVTARILPMGVNKDGNMQAPINIFDSGWYERSAKPGQKGAMVTDGHASGPTRAGLFAYLDTLTAGDEIRVERGDGSLFVYEVVQVESVELDRVDMSALLRPHESTNEGLNLITCTGRWVQEAQTYDHRTLVYARRIIQ